MSAPQPLRMVLAPILAGALASLTLATPSLADCGWLPDGFALAPTDSAQLAPVLAGDGAGGAYLVWQDDRGGGSTLFAQHLNAQGMVTPGWPDTGRVVLYGGFVDPMVVADGLGGAFFSATDGRAVHVGHLGLDGFVYDSPDGIAQPAWSARAPLPAHIAKDDPTNLSFPLADGAGGAFVTWEQGGHLEHGIGLQRFTPTAASAPGWSSFAWLQYYGGEASVTCRDGAGGVIAASRVGYGIDITRSLADAAAAPVWRYAVPNVGAQDAPGIVADGAGGAFVVWQDSRSGAGEQVYALRITADGDTAAGWPAAGLPVCTFATAPGLTRYPLGFPAQRFSSVASDGAGGMFVVWSDQRGADADIYAQHLLGDGTPAAGWPANGLPVCTAAGAQDAPDIVADATGGVFLAWQDLRSGQADAYVQHVSGAGAAAWSAGGVRVSTGPGAHQKPRIAADGAGGVIVAWTDVQGVKPQVYVSHVAADGSLPAPVPGARSAALVSSSAAGGHVSLVWHVTNASGTVGTVYSQHGISGWTPAAQIAPDANGDVHYDDAGALAGCVYGYALSVPVCQTGQQFGRVWLAIPTGEGFATPAVVTAGATPDSAHVRLDWQFANGAGLAVTVFERDSCSSWSAIGTTSTDGAGAARFVDRTATYEGQQRLYRATLDLCGAAYDAPDLAMTVPAGQGFGAFAATLTRVIADPAYTLLTWRQMSGPRVVANIYRQDPTGAWQLRASLIPDGIGYFQYQDVDVQPGQHVVYRLGLASCGDERLMPPIDVQIPSLPPGSFELALADPRPNPSHGSVSMGFTLAGGTAASLVVIDAGGRVVLRRDVGSLGPGPHVVALGDGPRLRPGLYVVRLAEGGRARSRRIVVAP